MPTAKNQAEFEAIANMVLKQAVDEITKITLEEITNFVREKWYINSPARTSGEYERTEQFLESFKREEVGKFVNTYVSMVYSDPNEMVSMYNDESIFNWHQSFDGSDSYNGTSIPEWLILWIEDGQSSPRYPYNGIHMYKETNTWLKRNLYRIMRQVFKKYGMTIKKTKEGQSDIKYIY